MRLLFSFIIVFCAVFLINPQRVHAADDNSAAAVSSAEDWLKRIDAAEYDASWQEASAFFRSAVDREQWVRNLSRIRNPLGAPASRTLSSVAFLAKLPDRERGEYAVVRMKTSFPGLIYGTENVLLESDKDGYWRVQGYFIGSRKPRGRGLFAPVLLAAITIAAWFIELR